MATKPATGVRGLRTNKTKISIGAILMGNRNTFSEIPFLPGKFSTGMTTKTCVTFSTGFVGNFRKR